VEEPFTSSVVAGEEVPMPNLPEPDVPIVLEVNTKRKAPPPADPISLVGAIK
jgi:hypothetical protein